MLTENEVKYMDKNQQIMLGVIVIALVGASAFYLMQPSKPPTVVDTDGDGVPDVDDKWPGRDDETFSVTLNLLIDSWPVTCDPHVYYGGTAGANYVYSTLFIFEGGDFSELKPCLATGYEVSDDGLTYTIHLRDDVTFHSGDKFTAQSINYTIWWMREINSPTAWILGPIQEIEIPDDYTIILTINAPFAPFLASISNWIKFVNPNYIEAHGGVVAGEENLYMRDHEDGTGPFKLVEWSDHERIVLEAYDGYFGGWDGPHIERIVYKFVPEYSTQLMLIASGDADMITSIKPPNIPELLSTIEEDDLPIITGERWSLTTTAMWLNMKALPFSDKNARLLIQHLIDRETGINEVMNGYALPAPTFHVPGTMGYGHYTTQYTYDPAKAAEYAELMSDEAREALDGSVWPFLNKAVDEKVLLQMLQTELRELDIEIEILELDGPSYFGRIGLDPEASDLMLICYWTADYPDPDGMIYALYKSDELWNRCFWGNETTDAILMAARSETDPVKREEMYQQLEIMIADDACQVLIYYNAAGYAAQEWMKGLETNFIYAGQYTTPWPYDVWKEP